MVGGSIILKGNNNSFPSYELYIDHKLVGRGGLSRRDLLPAHGGAADDQYTGLDRFGRVIESDLVQHVRHRQVPVRL